MNQCENFRNMVDAYFDSELDARSRQSLESHVSECESCRNLLESRKLLSKAVKRSVAYVSAPTTIGIHVNRQPIGTRRWLPTFAGVALVACLAAIGLSRLWPSPTDRIVSDLISNHQRTVSTAKPCDFVTSEPSVLKPWFLSHGLSFCPTLADMRRNGFNLLGGRVDIAQGQKVATFIYKYKNRMVDLFVTTSDYANAENLDRQGTFVRTWNDCGLNYWAVSNSNSGDLDLLHAQFILTKR